MSLTISNLQKRLYMIERKYHTPYFDELALRLLFTAWEYHLLPDIRKEELPLIATAARLHDLGKLSVSDTVLESSGPHTPENEAQLLRHPQEGKAILDSLFPPGSDCPPFIPFAKEICLHHHERWAGGGYPDQLKGPAIPSYVQVISLADSYDVLRVARQCRPALPHDAAKSLILNWDYGAFSPDLLRCFGMEADATVSGLYPGRSCDE